ncbi:MAG TPA: (Fe-S)-binding protein [Candidatus Lokiarchaeia archaeon]|nr:(Fe-S)-binding protein [Candidatus Lokiarchaeia archaeon]
MAENTAINAQIETLLNTCVRCGQCAGTCPSRGNDLSGAPRWEIFSSRGRVKLASGLLLGKIPPNDALVKSFFTCFFCANCLNNCPSGAKVTDIIQAVRGKLVELGVEPTGIDALAQNLDESGDIFGIGQDDRMMWSFNVEDRLENHVGEPAEVLYFIGCQESFKGSLAEIPENLILTLLHLNVNFSLLGEKEQCCGNPYFLAGNETKCYDQVEKNLATIAPLQPQMVIFTCPGCFNTFKRYEEKTGKTLPFKVQFALEFLNELLSQGMLQFPGNVQFGTAVYHDPCELGRHQGIYEAPRAILHAIPGLELVELDKNHGEAMCCGGGGLVGACDKDFALSQAQRKIMEVLGKQPDLLVTSCPACFDTLTNAKTTLDQAQTLRVKDIFTVIAEALDLSP